MNLFITGGTGFFGRALIRHLDSYRLATGKLPFEKITVLSRSPKQFRLRHPALANLPWIHWHTGDIAVPESLPQQGRYHYILHGAADSTDVDELTPLQRYQQIVKGTENMLNFAIERGSQRFLLTSSGGAYGPQPVGMAAIAETYNGMPDPLVASGSYGVAKRQAEHLCALYGQQFGIQTVIARCFSFVGEDLPVNAHFAIGNFIRDALQSGSITVQGDGTSLRSYMDQRDLSQWLITMLLDGQAGQAYNVGSDQEVSIRELAHTVRGLIAPHKEVRILGEPDKTAPRQRYIPCIEKAQNELRLKVTVNLHDAIRFAANTYFSGRHSACV